MEWKSFVLTEQDGKYLLIREAVKKWHGKWFLPGGKADLNETPEMTAHREVWEEAGCRVILKGIFCIKYREQIFSKTMTIYYAATMNGDQEIKRSADKHSLEAAWFSYEEIRRLEVRSGLREIVEAYRKQQLMPVENLRISA